MKVCSLLMFTLCLGLGAQSAPKTEAKPVAKAAPKAAKKAVKPATEEAKETPESLATRQALNQTLDAIHAAWFGKPYQAINAVELQGRLAIELSAAALNQKVDQLSQGQVKGGAIKSGKANLMLKGTYFANGDFRSEFTGDFGNLLYTRTGNRGFLYSKEQNAFTTRVDNPAPDAPLYFSTWFRQVLNDIKAVYIDGGSFKATAGKEESVGGRTLQTLVFNAPTAAYDPRKREQSLAETLGFWKRGRLEVQADKTTHLPYRMTYSNDSQGIRTTMELAYGAENRLSSVTFNNQSRGMEGPAFLRISYGGDGLMSQVSGELNGQNRKIAFDLATTWEKNKKSSPLIAPPGATKKGREELESYLMIGLAGNLLELQRQGLNLRSVPVSGK